MVILGVLVLSGRRVSFWGSQARIMKVDSVDTPMELHPHIIEKEGKKEFVCPAL